MSVVAKLFFGFIILYSSSAFSAAYYYVSASEALAACGGLTSCHLLGSVSNTYCAVSTTNSSGGGLSADYRNDTTANHYYGCNIGWASNCPASGMVRDPAGICMCPSGQTPVNGVCTSAPVQDCPAGQYRNQSNTCVSIPDCNVGNSDGYQYFDVQTSICTTPEFPSLVCGGSKSVACHPLDDCLSPGSICSNNQADIDANTARQAVVTPAKKTEATASAQTADNAKNDAVAASSAKQAAAQAAQQNNQAAQSAANSNPTAEALKAAATAATQAASAAAQAANAAASAQTTQGYATDAAAARDEITPSYPPGRAENAAEAAASAAGKAVADALKAIQGQAPDGNGTGEDMGTCPQCAKESTLESFKAGDGNSLTPGTPGHFDDAIVDTEIQTAKTAYSDKVNQIKTQFGQLLNIQLSGTGQLPVFDYGTINGVHVVSDFSRFTDLMTIGNLIIFIAGFTAIRIIMEF